MAIATGVTGVHSRQKRNGEKRKDTRQGTPAGDVENPQGLEMPRRYTRAGVHPFDAVKWDRRISRITERDGRVVFEMKDVEVPVSWSQLATDIIAQKYFRKAGVTPDGKGETSAKQVVMRIAKTIRDFGELHKYFQSAADAESFEMELTHILINQYAAFNSPVWFNCGHEHVYGVKGSGGNWAWNFAKSDVKQIENNYERPQCSACQPYHSMISTPQGMVPIGEIVARDLVGTKVYDSHGTTRIVATKANGSEMVFKVKLTDGNFIEATGDHLVRAVLERRTQPIWTRVDGLRPGMRLHLLPHAARSAQTLADGGTDVVSAAIGMALERDMGTEDPGTGLEVSEAALAGWLQSDGFVGQYSTGSNRSLTLEFETVNDEEFAWVLRHLRVALPGLHFKSTFKKTMDRKLLYRRVRLYGEVVRQFVEKYDLLQRGLDIRVPRSLFSASEEVVKAYLRSVYQAEGYVSRNGNATRIGLATISERWMEDIQLLLLSLGIYSRRRRKFEKRADRHHLHEIHISTRSERVRFAEKIGFISEQKSLKLAESLLMPGKRCPDIREVSIASIEPQGMTQVYDIQTGSGEYLSNNVVLHNCFIQNVEDSLDSMLELQKAETLLFKFGSGSGTNFSKIRGRDEPLAAGGKSSGVLSFLKGFDSWAGSIKSGGTTRRAAKMVVLDVDHPEIEDFITWKVKEERKAKALIAAGWDNDWRGEAYQTISGQNANNSVRIPDSFMESYLDNKEWSTIRRTDGHVHKTFKARELMRTISQAAWECADPGVQYHDVVNSWHTCPNTSPIRASNPCSEYMFLDDSACNLASINLMHYLRDDGSFDIESYRHTVRVVFTAMEILVDLSSYPTADIARNSHDYRPLGLGYANLGTLLMVRGIPYDSEEGRAWSAAISGIMCGQAYATSVEMARSQGPFEGYAKNREPFLRVMRRHTDSARNIHSSCPPLLKKAAVEDWEAAVREGEKHGFRNAQATVIAPTGTIGLLMDCDTTGIEPDFSIVKWKKLAGGGVVRIVNQSLPMALSNLGYKNEQVNEIITYILGDGSEKNPGAETVEGAPHLKEEHYAVFDCANKCGSGQRFLKPMAHVLMMAAV
ncbi:MAG TPA: adenosylcobalamin-dependent ribonucleoside-diphosphate reductase, partial [Thermoplasmata archaeon]|nr:adenosylcobalamin-dependent ribonucleoside-diphosphate reductase [Thermoplasmata archaeon]